MCDTNQISKHFRKPFFIKGQKSRLFKTKVFFWTKKWKRQKKTGDAKVDKKAQKNHYNQKEGKTEQEKCAPLPKKREKQNKENKVKNGEKGDEKNEEWKIQEEDTNQERETRRERKRKGDTQKRFSKQKKRLNIFFEKRENLFAHEKVSAQDKGGEKHFLFFFFQKKKGKVDQKNTFFCFFLGCDFLKKMRRNKTADETWELIEEEGEFKNMLVFFLWSTTKEKNK